MPGDTFSADQVIGHALYGLRPIPVYQNPYDSEPIYYTVPAGQYVGTVENYLQPSSYRKDFYWTLQGDGFNPLYVRHHVGDFSIDQLTAAGAQTVEQQIQAAKDEQLKIDSPIEYYVKKYGPWVLITILGGSLITGLVKKHL